MALRRRKTSSRTMVRLALIGAGGMANAVHYPALAEMNDVVLAGICDLDPARLTETAARFGIAETFTDYRLMLETVKPDGVYVLMPPQHVFEVAMERARAGPPPLHRETARAERIPEPPYGQARRAARRHRHVRVPAPLRNPSSPR